MNNENHPLWKIVEFRTANGEGVVSKWFRKCKKIDPFAEQEFLTILDNLSVLKKELWSMPEYRDMVNMEGIGEIRFQNKQKLQLRVFGMFLEDEQKYVMLGGAVKEGDNHYDPDSIKNTVISRRDDILQGFVDTKDFNYLEDE